ncbi:hypothetical protein SCHPADRAFT_897460, partial [Schizopora paradoxa]
IWIEDGFWDLELTFSGELRYMLHYRDDSSSWGIQRFAVEEIMLPINLLLCSLKQGFYARNFGINGRRQRLQAACCVIEYGRTPQFDDDVRAKWKIRSTSHSGSSMGLRERNRRIRREQFDVSTLGSSRSLSAVRALDQNYRHGPRSLAISMHSLGGLFVQCRPDSSYTNPDMLLFKKGGSVQGLSRSELGIWRLVRASCTMIANPEGANINETNALAFTANKRQQR